MSYAVIPGNFSVYFANLFKLSFICRLSRLLLVLPLYAFRSTYIQVLVLTALYCQQKTSRFLDFHLFMLGCWSIWCIIRERENTKELLTSRYHILLCYLTAACVQNKDMDMHAIDCFDVRPVSLPYSRSETWVPIQQKWSCKLLP